MAKKLLNTRFHYLKFLPVVLLAPLIYYLADSEFSKKDQAQIFDRNPQEIEQGDFKLSSLRGQAILLHFWATWCGPCLAELPELLALAKARPELQIVAIAADKDRQTVQNFFATHPGLENFSSRIRVLIDADQKISARYDSDAFPETFLINRHFLIDNKFIGPQNWSSRQMQEYLDTLSK